MTETLGARLREARIAHGHRNLERFVYDELPRDLEGEPMIKPRTLRRMENDEADPTPEYLKFLSGRAGVSTDWLLFGGEDGVAGSGGVTPDPVPSTRPRPEALLAALQAQVSEIAELLAQIDTRLERLEPPASPTDH